MSTNTEIVEKMFKAYQAQDRSAAEVLMCDSLQFTSQVDDHIDKSAFFERCFPTALNMNWQNLTEVVEAPNGVVLVRYQYEHTDGARHQKMEAIRVENCQIVEVDVYFGGRPVT